MANRLLLTAPLRNPNHVHVTNSRLRIQINSAASFGFMAEKDGHKSNHKQTLSAGKLLIENTLTPHNPSGIPLGPLFSRPGQDTKAAVHDSYSGHEKRRAQVLSGATKAMKVH